MQSQRPAGIPTDQGRSLQLGGLGVVFKIGAEATGGSLAVVEHPIGPGVLIFPHVHQHEDEYSFVIEGTIGARVGDQVLEARPGDCIVKPRGVPHTFWNPNPTTARVLEIISPAGFEGYFDELAEIFAAGTPPDMRRVAALIDRYGLIPRLDWVAELEETYGVTLNRPTTDEPEAPD